MPFVVIKGTFHIEGYSPDGDSVRFKADNREHWAKLSGRTAELNAKDHTQLSEGANYLDVCERAKGDQSQYAQSFGEGLRSVLSSREGRFGVALLLEEGGKLYMDPREPIPLEEVERMAGAAGAGEAAAGLTQPVPLEEVERRIEKSQRRIEESYGRR
jgi:hypothetical protein